MRPRCIKNYEMAGGFGNRQQSVGGNNLWAIAAGNTVVVQPAVGSGAVGSKGVGGDFAGEYVIDFDRSHSGGEDGGPKREIVGEDDYGWSGSD